MARFPQGSEGLGPVPGAGRRPWAISELVAWAAIVLAVAVTVWSVVQMRQARANAPAERTEEAGMQLLLSSRYAVGVNEFMKTLGRANAAAAASNEKALHEMLAGLARQAKRPEDQLRTAMLRGEIEGTPAALAQAQRLGEQSPSLHRDVDTLQQLYAGEAVTDAQWERFQQRHGWFAELAAATGKPDGDPHRVAVVNAGLRTMIALISIVLLALVAGVLGLVLMVVAFVRYRAGKLQPAFGRTLAMPADRRAYVQGFALFLGSWIGAILILRTAHLDQWIPEGASSVISAGVMLIAVLAGIFWPVFQGAPWTAWRAATGFHRGKGVLREIGSGILGYITGFPVLALGALITVVLVRSTDTDASHPLIRQLNEGRAMWTWVFVLATVWAPVTEELMFRGMLFAHLRERYGWWISAPVVALIFAMIHPQGWAAVPALAAIAIVFAGIREWRGSIIGCMTAHAVHNGVALLLATMMLR